MRRLRLPTGFLALGAALLAAGCASPRYAPGPYKPAPDRFGALALPAGGRTVGRSISISSKVAMRK